MHSFTMRWFYSIPLLLEMQPQGTGREGWRKRPKNYAREKFAGCLGRGRCPHRPALLYIRYRTSVYAKLYPYDVKIARNPGRCGHRPLHSRKTGDNGIEPFMKRPPPGSGCQQSLTVAWGPFSNRHSINSASLTMPST